MQVEGHVYFQGVAYDENGHCDDYDLMFCRSDNGEEICLNGFEDAVFPDHSKTLVEGKAWMPPMSVHDRMRGKLTIAFEKEEVEEGVIV